jgi:hypothetical protein
MRFMKVRGMKALGLAFVLATFVGVLGPDAQADQRNKCGCYRDDGGTCYCDKKAKCGCPGECEPKGCEEQRSRELQKQIDAETKKAEESGHRKRSGDENGDNGRAEERAPTRAASHKMSAAQSKELAKLIDLYVADHPDSRGRSLDEVRAELSR